MIKGFFLLLHQILTAKDSELNGVREELRKASDNLSEARQAKQDIEAELKRATDEKAELTKRLNTNEHVIDWLNKQLTHAQKRDPGLR